MPDFSGISWEQPATLHLSLKAVEGRGSNSKDVMIFELSGFPLIPGAMFFFLSCLALGAIALYLSLHGVKYGKRCCPGLIFALMMVPDYIWPFISKSWDIASPPMVGLLRNVGRHLESFFRKGRSCLKAQYQLFRDHHKSYKRNSSPAPGELPKDCPPRAFKTYSQESGLTPVKLSCEQPSPIRLPTDSFRNPSYTYDDGPALSPMKVSNDTPSPANIPDKAPSASNDSLSKVSSPSPKSPIGNGRTRPEGIEPDCVSLIEAGPETTEISRGESSLFRTSPPNPLEYLTSFQTACPVTVKVVSVKSDHPWQIRGTIHPKIGNSTFFVAEDGYKYDISITLLRERRFDFEDSSEKPYSISSEVIPDYGTSVRIDGLVYPAVHGSVTRFVYEKGSEFLVVHARKYRPAWGPWSK